MLPKTRSDGEVVLQPCAPREVTKNKLLSLSNTQNDGLSNFIYTSKNKIFNLKYNFLHAQRAGQLTLINVKTEEADSVQKCHTPPIHSFFVFYGTGHKMQSIF